MRPAHSRDLRKGRSSEPGRVYLVTTRTADSRRIFTDLHRGRIVVDALRWSDTNELSSTWAFVVMPDHLHWLFALGRVAELSSVVGRVKSFTSQRLRKRFGAAGACWQPGFHDHALRVEEDLQTVARYVVLNPVRAGLVDSVREYPLWDAKWV